MVLVDLRIGHDRAWTVEVDTVVMRRPDGPFWVIGVYGIPPTGTWSRPTPIPADVYQDGTDLVVIFDLPGVEAGAIHVQLQANVITVQAERRPADLGDGAKLQLSERALGAFGRQVHCNRPLDRARVSTHYEHGVLTLRVGPAGPADRPVELARATATPTPA
jgi:HSP20 family protein